MSTGYTSWNCPDLNNATLYSSDITTNPDWAWCSLVKPFGYNIIDHFKTQIDAAFANQTDWSSGIIKLARLVIGGSLNSNYLQIEIKVITATNNLNVTVGYGYGSSFRSSQNSNYAYTDYLSFKPYQKCVYILRSLDRDNPPPYANLPNYTGKKTYVVTFGHCKLYVGRWESPSSPSYPWGRMVYTLAHSVGDIRAALLSIPCAYNNEESRHSQSEGVFEPLCYDSIYSSNTNYYVGDYSGNYDDDTTAPMLPDPNAEDPAGPSGPGGGGGNHDSGSDPISIPGLPGVSALNTGFLTLYFGNAQMIHAFLSNLWVSNIAQAIKNFFQQPMDFMVGAMILPIASQLTAAQSGTASPVFNNEVFDSALPYTNTQFFEVDCGTLDINEYWGSCFDFDPYTKITIWLPFIGYRDLLADEVMGHSIYVKYHIDALTGDCVAFVGVSSVGPQGPDITKILGQFSGNCGVQIPISGQSFDALVSSTINMLTSVTGFGLSAKLGGGSLERSQAGNAFSSLTNSAVSVVTSSKPDVQRSGAVGASSGMMGCRIPYIIKRIPRQSLPTNYQAMKGYPSNIYATLSQLESGYAEVDDIQLNNIPAMEEERKEIMELLKGGVLL